MKTVKKIGCIIIIVIIVGAILLSIIMNWLTRDERAAREATYTALADQTLAAEDDLRRTCLNPPGEQTADGFSGNVFVMGFGKTDLDHSAIVSEYTNLISFAPKTTKLEEADAILCVNVLDVDEKICEMTSLHLYIQQPDIQFTLLTWPGGELIAQTKIESFADCPGSWSGLCENNKCSIVDKVNVIDWLKSYHQGE